MAVIGYLYTGIGYQYIGMGKKVYDNMWAMRQFYDKVEKILPDFKINKISFIGPEDDLKKEENALLIMTTYQSGIYEVLKEKKIFPEQVSGYKSGELTALINSGVLSFSDGIKFLRKKIEIMNKIINKDLFIQILINNVEIKKIKEVVEELKKKIKIDIISYNTEESAIITCEKNVKDKIINFFTKLNGNIIELPDEELSNFYLLEEALPELKEIFLNFKMDKPTYRLLSQTTGNYYDNIPDIKEKFLDYIYKPARIDLIITNMIKNGVNTFVEIGCGTFLSRCIKKIDSGKRVLNTHDLKSLSLTIKLAN